MAGSSNKAIAKNEGTEGMIRESANRINRRLNIALALICSVAMAFTMVGAPAIAQDAPVVLEEIIVTARKRDESLQDVAVSVSAIGAELNQANMRRLEDIQTFSPNLYIRREPGVASAATISIRGVGTQDVDKSLDPAIGVMMDGMFLGTASGVLMQNFDVKRIEVLRGPQGTLFGKNTTGGLINIIRGDVTMNWGGDFRITADQNGRQDYKGVVNIPIITDKLGVKVFGAQIKSSGFVKNTTLNRNVGGDNIKNYGFAAQWQATDNFDIKFHYERLNDRSDQGAYVNENLPYVSDDERGDITCTLPFLASCVTTTTDNRNQNSANGSNRSNNKYKTYILTSNYNFSNMLLTYIWSKRNMDEENLQHFDAAPVNLLEMNFFNEWDQGSHELRLTSQLNGPVNFVAGLYAFNVDYAQRWDVAYLHYTLGLIGAPGHLDSAGRFPSTITTLSSNGQAQKTNSYAAFVSADWDITDQWTLTVGGRYTQEKKNFIGGNGGLHYDPAAGESPPALYSPVRYNGKWNEFTPSAAIRYQINNNQMVWASFAKGFKSGGFFGRQANFALDASFQPEYVTNYEVGVKSTYLGGALTFNSAMFFSNYQDKQESILIPVSLSNVATVVRNASTEKIFGAEIDVSYQIMGNWFVRGNYGYINASYDKYLADINGDRVVTDNSNLTPRNTPKHTFGVSTMYTMPVGTGNLMGNLQGILSFRYRGKIEADASNNPLGHLDSIANLDAQISYLLSQDRYRITFYGKNLTNSREKRVQLITPLTTRGYWSAPKTYGLEVAATF